MITKRTNPKETPCCLSLQPLLATFTLVARPAFADEAKTPETSSQPTEILAPAQETAVTNVEVKATTTNLSQLILSYLLVQVQFLVKLLAVKSHHLN